jgi:tetratricopeptide (TPR) repeat protein
MPNLPADDLPVPPLPDAPDSARWFGDLSQRDFDVEFYERVLQRQPDNVRTLKLLGELYARQGHYDHALRVDRRLAELLPRDAVVRYNLACSLAMQGAPEQAVAELRRAIELGYNDLGQLEVDPDLESVRGLPQYQALTRQLGLGS